MSTRHGSEPLGRRQAHRQAETDSKTSTTSSNRAAELDRDSVVSAQESRYGGIKIGAAFFGWLTATGTAVLLTAVVAAAGTAVAVATNTDVAQATSQVTQDPKTIGTFGSLVLLVLLFVAYFCGGYVAGRMARFNGAKQGLAVWLWALLVAIVVAILGVVGGSKYNVLGQLNSFPRIPVNEGDVTTAGVVALIAVAVASLAGAVLGGLTGMRFHRKVDQVGIESQQNVTVPVTKEEVRLEREPVTEETTPVERVRMDAETVTEDQEVSEEARQERIEAEGAANARGHGADTDRR